jgi:prophage regulatory protein
MSTILARSKTGIPPVLPRYLLRRPEVQSAIGVSRTEIYRRIANGTFPPPVPLGARSVGWPSDEVATVVDAIVSGSSENELRKLVAHLVAARGGR